MSLNLATIVNASSLPGTLEVRQLLKSLVDRQDDEFSMFDYLNFKGRAVEAPVNNVEYFHYLNESLYDTAEVSANVAASAAGGSSSITLVGAASVKPLVNDIIFFPNGINGLVKSVSAAADPVIVVQASAGESIPAVTDGDKLIFASNAYAEGAGTSSIMRNTDIIKRSNYIQKFKTMYRETDFAAGTEIELEFGGKPYMFYKQEYEAMRRHEIAIAFQGYLGTKSNSLTDADGNKVYTTEGLRSAIANGGGIQHTTATANTFSPLVDLLAMSVLMDANRCPSDYDMWASQSYDNAVDVGVANTGAFNGGGISYADYNGGDAINIAMKTKKLTMFGYSINKMRFQPNQHKGLTGAPGYEAFKKEAYFIPNGKIKTHASNGELVDRIRIRYMGLHGSYDKRYNVVYTGALVPTPTDNRDVFEVTYSSNQGYEFIGTDHFMTSKLA